MDLNPTEELLAQMGGTAPTMFNPTPGFSPLLRYRGEKAFDWFTPSTDAEKELVDAAKPLLRKQFTVEEHGRFRLALFNVYKEQGYAESELADFFSDVMGSGG